MRLFLLLLSLFLTVTSVHGNGSISPICDITSTIRPIHPAGAKPATAASSQSLQPSAGSYTPNTPMTITISGTINGLVIYARDSTGTHVGRWTAAAGTQLITCTGINAPKYSAPTGTTLSHSNSNPKTNLRLTWTSPAVDIGPITFQGMFTNGDAEANIYLFNDVTIMPPPQPTQPSPVITQPPPIGPVGPTAAPVVPQPPTGVVPSAGNGLITIQFTPPRDNGGSPILGYTVSVISPPNSGIKSEYRSIPPIFFLVTNDIPYVFSIVATNAIGSSQAVTTMAVTASDTISVASAPTNIQVIPGNGQATVSWSLPMQTGGSIISAYTVYAYEGLAGAQNVITVRTGAVYSATVTGLKPGTSYIFSVAAINQMGVGMMATTQQAVLIPVIGTIPLPQPITGVKAVALDRTVRLTWDPPMSTTSPILGYVIRSNTGLQLNATGQPVTFDGLMNNVPYTFTVAAINVAGTGAFSIPSAAVIPFTPANLGTPGQPRIISVIADVMGGVTVTFQPPTDVGAAPITSYTVTSSMTGTTKSGTSSPITFAAGVLPTGTYTFVVVAINSKGSSPASLPSMPISVVSSTQVMAPGSPTITNLDVSKDGSTIVVTFDPPLSDGNSPITSYTAYTSDNLASVKGTASPLTLTNVQYVDGLMVYVSATNAIGTSMPNPSAGVRIDLPTGTGVTTTPAPGAGTGGKGVAGFDTGKGFSCTWVISPDRVYIDVTMIGQTKGYVSWGVASGPLMLNNADYYTGYVDDTTGAVVMRDTFSNAKVQPKDDAQQDIVSFSGTQVNGVTTITFRRKLDTGDRREDFAITNADLYVHWAIAPADNLALYHNAYGIVRANLFTGQSSTVTLGGGLTAASLLCYMMLGIFVAYAVLRMVRRCTKNIRHHSHITTLQKQSSSSEVVPTSFEHQKSMSSLNSSANMMRQQASSLSKYHDRLSGADQESQWMDDRSLQTNPALLPQAWGVSSSVSSSDGGLKHRRMNTTITPAVIQPNSAQWQRWEAQWQPLQTEEGWQYFFNQTTQETAWEIPPMPDYFTGEQGARYSMAERPSPRGIDADQIKVETVPARPAMAPSAAAARYALAKKSSSCLARIKAILHYRIPRSQFSATQIMVFVGYIILNIICLMMVDQDTPLATRYGWLATANMLIVAVPATRNSVLVWVLGYAFDTVMVFHRWIGRLLLIIVSAHMFGWYALWRSQGLSIYEMQFSNISYQRGFYGWVALVVVNVLSLDFFRRRHFEFFYHTHFTFFVFYAMAYLHKPSQGTYFLITLIMYGIDRLIRTFWGIVPRKTTIVKAKGGDIVQVRFPKHPLARATKLYKVGQYVFVNFPELSLFQWHPFSISSAPEENTAEIHIRSLGDYTKAMLQRVRETKNNEMWIRVDGPYGNHRMTYHRYPVLILVGGGIGITPIISILKDIYHVGDFDPHKQPKVNAIEGICCVWVIPNQATYEWFADEFEKLVQASQNPMMPPLFLWVYVTRDKNLSPNSSFVSGKPDFDHIFECAARDYRGKATCVFSCGPDLMVSSCWDATNARKRAGDTFDFHHETFEW